MEEAINQILSGERDGFKTFDEAMHRGLANLTTEDPLEYKRKKPEAAEKMEFTRQVLTSFSENTESLKGWTARPSVLSALQI